MFLPSPNLLEDGPHIAGAPEIFKQSRRDLCAEGKVLSRRFKDAGSKREAARGLDPWEPLEALWLLCIIGYQGGCVQEHGEQVGLVLSLKEMKWDPKPCFWDGRLKSAGR